jgi:hypothetical protein
MLRLSLEFPVVPTPHFYEVIATSKRKTNISRGAFDRRPVDAVKPESAASSRTKVQELPSPTCPTRSRRGAQ